METILIVVHLLLALGLVGLVLLQHGKGADAGAAFGSGASATVFGARGSANFLSRATGVLAALFFITTLVLAWFAMNVGRDEGLVIDVDSATTEPVVIEKRVVESDLPAVPDSVPEASAASDTPDVPTVTPDAPTPSAEQE